MHVCFLLPRKQRQQNWPLGLVADELLGDVGSDLFMSVVVELTLSDDGEVGELGWIIPDDELVFVVVTVVVVAIVVVEV